MFGITLEDANGIAVKHKNPQNQCCNFSCMIYGLLIDMNICCFVWICASQDSTSYWSFMNYVKPCLNQIVDNLDIALQHRFFTATKICWGYLPYAWKFCMGLIGPGTILDLQSSSRHATQGLAHKCGFPTHICIEWFNPCRGFVLWNIFWTVHLMRQLLYFWP